MPAHKNKISHNIRKMNDNINMDVTIKVLVHARM